MSDDFSPLGGNGKAPAVSWSGSTNGAAAFTPLGGNGNAPAASWSASANDSSIFVPYPASSQPAVPEVGYDEGGYGEGGYDAPAVAAIVAPTTNWTDVSSK